MTPPQTLWPREISRVSSGGVQWVEEGLIEGGEGPRTIRRGLSRLPAQEVATVKFNYYRLDSDASLKAYLRDIRRYPLLSREEEVEVARRVQQGDQEALECLVTSNLRFVITIARKFQNQGLSLADLINEGNVGLIRAAVKFDPERGVKFISYAVWWIRQAIMQSLAEQSRIVRIPLNRAGTFHRMVKRLNSYSQELGREPTEEELAEDMKMDPDEVRETLRISQPYLPIDGPVADDDGYALKEYLADERAPQPDEAASRHLTRQAIEESLSILKDREAQIIRLYYGLDDREPMTLEEIGRIFGITRERVRQIKENALSRLREVLDEQAHWPSLN